MIVTRRFLVLWGFGLGPALLVWQLWPGWEGATTATVLPGVLAALTTLGIYNLLLVLAAVIDWRLTEDPEEWQVERSFPRRLMIGEETRIDISIILPVRRPLRLQIRDEHPPELERRGEPEMVALVDPTRGPRQRVRASYRLFADRRGEYGFGDVVVRWASPLGLLIRQARFPAATLGRVYPNIARSRRQIVASREMRTMMQGVRLSNFRGSGREFESLRDYVTDDQLRHVSWTATARRGKLTTRQYQVERNQSIVLMIDAGRLMTSRIERLTKLDHAINAALTIASVAIDNGDMVGLLVFERDVAGYLPPRRGNAQLTSILESLCEVEPRMIEPAYNRAFEYLQRQCRKRSLVIILTDLVDRDASSDLLNCAASLLPRHLPLIVAIGDQDLRWLVSRPPGSVREVYRQSVAEEVLRQREEALGRVVERGGLALDLQPGTLPTRLVQQYLEIKRRGLL